MAKKVKPVRGLPVSGYRAQQRDAIALVNGNKEAEERILRQLDKLSMMPSVDQAWLADGRRLLELAFMQINRSIFKPARVNLPGDGK